MSDATFNFICYAVLAVLLVGSFVAAAWVLEILNDHTKKK